MEYIGDFVLEFKERGDARRVYDRYRARLDVDKNSVSWDGKSVIFENVGQIQGEGLEKIIQWHALRPKKVK